VPSVVITEYTDLAPAVVLAAARDFSDRRADMWPDVHTQYLTVHEGGNDYAVVTEGNPWPIGYVWERLRYDWSSPDAIRGTVIDSNLFKPGSTWELWAYPEGDRTRVDIRATRHLQGRGWLLAPFFVRWVPGSVDGYVGDHLRHFLSAITEDGYLEAHSSQLKSAHLGWVGMLGGGGGLGAMTEPKSRHSRV